MKKTFQITEQEKKEILEQHNFFKKVLQSKSEVKRLMVNEQTTPITGGGIEFLKAARASCKIAKGAVIKSSPGKPTILYKKADYNSEKGYFKIGDELYIKDDFTFNVITTDADGNRKLTYANRKWECDELTAPFKQQMDSNIAKTKLEGDWKTKEELLTSDTEQNILNPEMYDVKVVDGVRLYRNKSGAGVQTALTPRGQQIFDKYKAAGGLEQNKVDPELSQTLLKVKIGGKPDFSEDFYMYFDPKTTVRDAAVAQAIQTSIESLIPEDKKDCKRTIEAYYTNFKKKRMIEPNQLSALKYKVQSCKNEFYKDWGFVGGNKIDDYLDMLSGVKSGGPSSYGEDSKWRIK